MNTTQLSFAAATRAAGKFALALLVLACSACSTLSLDAAKSLGASGKDAATKIQAAAFVTDAEFSHAMDAEALFHGASGAGNSQAYKDLLALYKANQNELAKRAVVLSAMGNFYDAFTDLATYDARGEVQTALQNLGGAVDSYRTSVLKEAALPASTFGAISAVGGIIAAEIQKNALKQSSAAVRPVLESFTQALQNKLVREQFTGFKIFLAVDRKTAIDLLWDKGVFDPSPLINDIGTDAGLSASRDAGKLVLADKTLRSGLEEVMAQRLQNQIDALQPAYDASVQLLQQLIVEHKKFEEGAPLDLAKVREIIAQLQSLISLFAKK